MGEGDMVSECVGGGPKVWGVIWGGDSRKGGVLWNGLELGDWETLRGDKMGCYLVE